MPPLPRDGYIRWIHEQTGYWPTWTPGSRVDLGDIGYIDDHRTFVKHGSLNEILHMTARSDLREKIRDNLVYNTHYFAVTAEVQGSVNNLVNASVTFSSKKQVGHVLQIKTGAVYQLRNEAEILSAVKDSLIAGRWHLNWLLIAEVRKADAGFALCCEGRDATITMAAKTADPLPLSPNPKQLASADLSISSSKGSVIHYPFVQNSTPLIDRPWRVCKRLARRLDGGSGVYDPQLSRMGRHELERMPVDQLFEQRYR